MNRKGLHSTVLLVFNERQDVFPAYRLYAGDSSCFQKLQKKPNGCAVVFQGTGAPVSTVKMRKVFFGELNARQLLSFELKRELVENLPGRIPDVPSECEIDLRAGGLKLTRFYLF